MSKLDAPPSAQPGFNDDERDELKHILHVYWAVRVLWAYAAQATGSGRYPHAVPNPADGGWAIFLPFGSEFQGDTPDDVTVRAAEALAFLDPTLTKGLENIWPLRKGN